MAVALCVFVGTARAQAPWNPHAGLEPLFRTEWQHKGATRYPQPQQISLAVEAIQWANATLANADRPAISAVIPSLIDARRADKLESWRMLEVWQWAHEPIQGGGDRWLWLFSGRDVPQWRVHHPPTATSGETYSILLDVSPNRDYIDILPGISGINYASFGGRKIKVYASGRIDIGPITIKPDLTIRVANLPSVVVKDARGVPSALKVEIDGRMYGVELKLLP